MAGYVYNPFGIRVRSDTTTTINQGSPVAKKKAFVIDAHNGTGYAQVLEEKDGTGAVTMSYTIGDDVIAQSGPSVTHHFGYDGHSSTRILTDDNAAIESGARYDYDAYGVQIGETFGASHLPLTSLLYTGEQFDVDLQQYYLRARYYDQSRGRFTQLDSFGGIQFEPESVHKYNYTHGDPINRLDPSGQMSLTEKVAVTAIISLFFTLLFGSATTAAVGYNIGKDVVPDGFLVNLGAAFSPYPGTAAGVSVQLLLDFKTRNFYVFGTAEGGTAPITAYAKHRGSAPMFSWGLVWNMQDPSQLSGPGSSFTFPYRLRNIAFPKELRRSSWIQPVLAIMRYMSPNTRYKNRQGIGHVAQSFSGPAYAGSGFWTYSLAWMITMTTEPVNINQLPDDMKEIVENLKQHLTGLSATSTPEAFVNSAQGAINWVENSTLLGPEPD